MKDIEILARAVILDGNHVLLVRSSGGEYTFLPGGHTGWREGLPDALRRELGEELRFEIRANRFLHHMVRNIVGTMVEVGRGSMPSERIPELMAARDRRLAGPTAPARGLYLVNVIFGEEWLAPEI